MDSAAVAVIDVAAALLAVWLFHLVRRDRLYVGYGVIFVLVLIAGVVLLAFPGALGPLNRLALTLARAPGLLALALAFILLMLIYILTQVTLLSNRLTTLTQELAIRRAAKAANPPAGATDAVDPGAGESGSSMRLGRSATSTMSNRTSPSMTKP